MHIKMYPCTWGRIHVSVLMFIPSCGNNQKAKNIFIHVTYGWVCTRTATSLLNEAGGQLVTLISVKGPINAIIGSFRGEEGRSQLHGLRRLHLQTVLNGFAHGYDRRARHSEDPFFVHFARLCAISKPSVRNALAPLTTGADDKIKSISAQALTVLPHAP